MGPMLHAVILLAATALILLSLAALPPASMLALESLGIAAVFLSSLRSLFARSEKQNVFDFLQAAFVFWIFLQCLAIWQRVPFFESGGSWAARHDLLLLFFCGLGYYFAASELLIDRKTLTRFLYFLSGASAALAVYFIALLFTSKTPVESIKGPYFILRHLGEWAGNTIQPNNLVDLFIPGFFYSLSLFLYDWTRGDFKANRQELAKLLLELCLAGVLLAACLLTRSRAGILAVVIPLLVYFVFFFFSHQRKTSAAKRFFVLFGVILFFLLSLGLREILQEMSTVAQTVREEQSLEGARSLTMGASLQIVRERGILGVGLGNFQAAWLFHHREPFLYFPERSYNDFLWLWAENGVPGILFFLSGLLYFMIRSLWQSLNSKSYLFSYTLIASACSALGFLIHGLVDPTFYVAPLYWLLCICFGVGMAASRLREAETSPPPNSSSLPVRQAGPHVLRRGSTDFDPGFLIKVSSLTLLLFSLGLAWLEWRLIYSQALAKKTNESAFYQSLEFDSLHSAPARRLAAFLEDRYDSDPAPPAEKKSQILAMWDLAIEREPFNLSLYLDRAGFLLKLQDEAGIQNSFVTMIDRLPNFYRAEIAASGFYMTASRRSAKPDQAQRFETKALYHYRRAKEYYPDFPAFDLYLFASPEAHQRFQELIAAGKL